MKWKARQKIKLSDLSHIDVYLPRQKQSALSVKADQCLPPLALEILDMLSLIKHKIVPTLSFEGK
jgi:hypothetical protein